MDLSSHAAGIGALADDTRRALYEYVSAQREPVGREQVAVALELAPHNVNFHLDKLVAEGLLETEYRRLSGKTGPGAGRPSKLYRRAAREFAVSLPPRRYDLVGDILAAAVTRASEGEPLEQSLHDYARQEGLDLAESAEGLDLPASLPALAQVLASQGYEPQVGDDVVVLSNCPFDALAQKHTALVCGLNQTFVQGVADGLGCPDVTACLEPEPGRCCVKARAGERPIADDHPDHGNPVEGEPSDDPVGVLERWETSGGHWRVLARSDARVTLGLFSCDGGEQMGRVTGRAVDLAAYLAGRTQSDD